MEEGVGNEKSVDGRIGRKYLVNSRMTEKMVPFQIHRTGSLKSYRTKIETLCVHSQSHFLLSLLLLNLENKC